MRSGSKKLILAGAIAAAAAFAAGALFRDGEPPVFDKFWVDRVPDDPRAFAQVLLFNSEGFGLMGKFSQFRFLVDTFEFEQQQGSFRVHRLQEDITETWTVNVWACKGDEAPNEDFVHCMSVERNGEVTRYFARERGEIRSARELMRALRDRPDGDDDD